jgi:tripartite-type tricarboxylate transporter receptor subunit TctC
MSPFCRIALALCLALPSCIALAQGDKSVRFVVGFTPGGPSDILARALAAKLSEARGQPVVVENRPGAGGNLAAEVVAKSAPDGNTWLLGNNSILATNAALYGHLPFDPVKDFTPVALVAVQPNILVVHPSVPATSVAELIAYAKAHAGRLNYASSGAGAAAHLSGELFKAMTGVDMVHVPYKGAQPALTDVIAGQCQLMFATSASVLPYVKAGRLRALAVTTAQRSPSVPELPTVAESGVPGFESITWHGVVVPSATPAPIIERLNRDINAALRDRELRARLEGLGAEIAGGTPPEFAAYIAREIPKWTKVVRDSGAKAE